MTKRTDRAIARRRAKSRKHYREHPEMHRAKAAVAAARKRGDLVRSDECSACGDIGPTVAHHWSYEEKHWLDVVWMDRSCHAKYT